MGDLTGAALVLFGFADLFARVQLSWRGAGSRHPALRGLPAWLSVYGGALLVTVLVTRRVDRGLLLLAAVAVASALAGRGVLRLREPHGYLAVAAITQFRIAAVVWLGDLALTVPAGALQRGLLLVLAAVAVAVLPVLLVDNFLLQEAACRDGWEATGESVARPDHPPRVSVHVPCYAEPPDVVAGTLDALSRLDYADFEVLVIDNNTPDEALWQPVREHCARLGARFRFYHVAPLAGAKAGALNFALARTDPRAELIAVVDADYQAVPEFLRDLVGAFTDQRLAFVQTSHDYRDWTANAYLTGCYWEYRMMYGGYMRSRSARESALTTGTMCVIRKEALQRVSGWAQWCCTEDSELSVRLHAAGYTGRYLHRTYGRGLIPETFAAYKRQRHRWIYGPTQEFRRHWRLFLPARWATPSALRPAQKRLFAHHGLRELAVAAASLTGTLAVVALLLDLSVRAPRFAVSGTALIGLAAGTLSGAAALWPLLRRVVGCPPAQAWRAIACRLALFSTRLSAGRAGWRSAPGRFVRTDKFPSVPDWAGALAGTAGESIRGVGAVALAVYGLTVTPDRTAVLPLAGYLMLRAAGWLAAPVLAVSADRALRRPGRTGHPG